MYKESELVRAEVSQAMLSGTNCCKNEGVFAISTFNALTGRGWLSSMGAP